MRLGQKRTTGCHKDMGDGDHGCYLNKGHGGPCKCSPFCEAGHDRAPYVWVMATGEKVAKACKVPS